MFPKLLVLLAVLLAHAQARFIVAGVLDSPSNLFYEEIRIGGELASDWFNERGGARLPGGGRQNVTLEIQFANSTEPDVFVSMYTALCDRFDAGEIHGLLGPVVNPVPVFLLANARHVPILFSGGPDLLCKDQPYVLCVQPSWSDMPTTVAAAYSGQMVQRVGGEISVSTVSRVGSLVQHPLYEAMGAFDSAVLEQFQLQDVGRKVFTLPLETYDAATADPLLVTAMSEWLTDRSKAPQVLVVCGWVPFQAGVLALLKRLDFSPAVVLTPMQSAHEALLQSYVTTGEGADFRYVGGVGLFHPSAKYFNGEFYGTAPQFDAVTRARYGRPATDNIAFAAHIVFFFASAHAEASSSSGQDVMRALRGLSVNTFLYGWCMRRADGLIANGWQFMQFTDRKRELVYPPLARTASQAIFPVPAWSERTFKAEYLSSWEVVFSTTCTSIAVVLLLVGIALVLRHADSPVIRATSVAMTLLSIVGMSLCVMTNFVWLPYATDGLCFLRPMLLGLGSSLFLVAYLAKTWRLFRIFHSKSLTQISATSQVFAQRVTLLILLDLSLVLAFVVPAGAHMSHVSPDPDRPVFDYLQCEADHPALLWMLLAYRGLLLLALAVLSFYVRDLEDLFCEAKAVFWSTWVLVFSTIVVVAFTAAADARSSYLFRSLMTCAVGLIVVGTFIVPRLYLVAKERDTVKSYTLPRSENTVAKEKTLLQQSVVDSSVTPTKP